MEGVPIFGTLSAQFLAPFRTIIGTLFYSLHNYWHPFCVAFAQQKTAHKARHFIGVFIGFLTLYHNPPNFIGRYVVCDILQRHRKMLVDVRGGKL